MHAQHIEFLELLNGQVQYVVPRWQRRYRWGQPDIERLVEDLVTVAAGSTDYAHYGGTLLTFQEPGAAGVVKTIRVVDGQQRLTTVSILLACIAAKLGTQGVCGDWTAQIIQDDRLTNPGKPIDKRRKLRLQDGDEEEYRRGLEGNVAGPGAVAQAWRTVRRLVNRHGVADLIKGLERLKVVSIGLEGADDPQQIFESLNATGRPLTESEKVKNWLLMGLPDEQQQELHDNYWLEIERALGAEYATEPIDMFLRDVLRWRTGDLYGIDRVYDGLRRWAVRGRLAEDRPALCRDLARLAQLYGILTGTAGEHDDARVEQEIRHLRAMGIDIHRPLTLRLLNDSSESCEPDATNEALAMTLKGIGTWTTRIWLSDRATAGLNKAVVEMAHGPGPTGGEDCTEYWLERIRRLRTTRVGVPNDEAVGEGIRTRKAYGGTATGSSFAVLCALMEAERPDEAPARTRLTIEHVMPQKLTDKWKSALGDEAAEKHERYCNRLPNLTLSGDATNPSMAARPFAEKRSVYRDSPIGMTRRIAEESDWDEEALERRAADLTRRVLERWPWPEQGTGSETATFRWRIEGGPWHTDSVASQMVLNVAGALLSRDSDNATKLSGDAISSNIHLASNYAPGSKVGRQSMRAVPGHDQYVIHPYERDYPKSAQRCQKMGERCGVSVEVELAGTGQYKAFWALLKDHVGGLPGQKEEWRGPHQRTRPANSSGDRIGIHVGNADLLWLYIRSGDSQKSGEGAARMRQYSWMIREQMGDQKLEGDLEKNSRNGITISVRRQWTRDDQDEWPEAARWITEQHERLRAILADPPAGTEAVEP